MNKELPRQDFFKDFWILKFEVKKLIFVCCLEWKKHGKKKVPNPPTTTTTFFHDQPLPTLKTHTKIPLPLWEVVTMKVTPADFSALLKPVEGLVVKYTPQN